MDANPDIRDELLAQHAAAAREVEGLSGVSRDAAAR